MKPASYEATLGVYLYVAIAPDGREINFKKLCSFYFVALNRRGEH